MSLFMLQILKKSVEWYCNLLGIPQNNDPVELLVYNIPVTSETGLTLDDHTFVSGFKIRTIQ
ncbi:hypothetical protein [Peribacillus butanolivorans]|uniref:hypothetical protein n=1 Tax=Peribacillus butanolivorans TaxID=421767 RepID=UPI00365118EE